MHEKNVNREGYKARVSHARAKSINGIGRSQMSNGSSLFAERRPQVEFVDKRQLKLRKEMDAYAEQRKKKYQQAVAEAIEIAR